MESALALAPLVLAIAGFEVWCLVDIARHPPRFLPRWAWIVVCLASIPLGAILYVVIGRDPDAPGRESAPSAEVAPPSPTPPPVPTAGPPTEAMTGTTRDPTARRTPGSTGRAGPHLRTGDHAIETSGLSKRYGSHLVLDDICLNVPSGSIYGLVGPNGAGKTTLLSLLAGLRRPTSGSIGVRVQADRVAVLPDTPAFEPWMTAREVVDLARGLSAPRLGPDRTSAALSTTGLLDVADRRTGGFSRGMLQRLGLAATIVGEPELVLLDEPCSALDPSGRREVLDLVARLAGEHTVLFCSHILGDVQEVCDTVGILRDGHLMFQGRMTELLRGHASPAFRLRVRPPVAPLVDRLESVPWVESVEQLGAEELRVTVRDLDAAESGMPATLAAAGARVVSMVPDSADLEHVFLELTGRSPGAGA